MARSSKIRGITIEIGGNTTKLGQALHGVESQTKSLQSELRGVNTLLKLDPSNVELLKQKQDLLNQSINETKKKQEILNETLKKIKSGEIEVTEEQYRDLQREIIATDQKLEGLQDQMKEFGSISERVLASASEKIKKTASNLEEAGQKMTGVSAATSAAIGGSVIMASSLEDATAQYVATTGKAITETEKYQKVLQNIHDNNYGEDYADIADKMRIVSNILGDLPTDQLQSVVEKSYMLEESFGMDFQETLRGINNLMYQYRMTADEAFDLFTKGAQEGLNYTDELGDNVSEYVGNFKQAGYSATEYFQLLKNGSENGAYNLDKVNDAINEATNRLADGSVEKNLNIFSSSSQKLFKTWQKGGATQKQVIDSIVKDIKECTNEQKALTMAATLFGTMGEDANLDFVKSLTSVGDEFKNVSGTAEQAGKTISSTTKNQMEQSIKKLKSSLASLSKSLMPMINDIVKKVNSWIDSFNDLDDETKKLVLTVGGLVAALSPALIIGGKLVNGFSLMVTGVGKTITVVKNLTSALKAATTAQESNNLAVLKNPYVLAAAAVAGLTAALVILAKKQEEEVRLADKTWVAANNLEKKHKELTKTLKEEKQARDALITTSEEQGMTADILFSKLEELSNVEEKTNAQKETMKILVNELNELMPSLNLQYNAEKDALNFSTQAIKNNINAQKELLKARAAQENLTNIAQKMAKLEIENAEATRENTKARKEYLQAQKELKKYTEEYTAYELSQNPKIRKEYDKLILTEQRKKDAYEKTKKVLKDNEKSLKDLNNEYNNTQKYAENMFSQAEIQQQLAQITELAKNSGIEIPKSIVTGIEEGKYAIPTTIEGLNSLIQFNKALETTKLAGVTIPQAISQQLLNGTITVQEAIAQVNGVVQFNSALEKAKNDGMIIPQNLATNMMNGTITVQQAKDQLNAVIEFNKAMTDAQNAGITIPEKLQDGIKSGKIKPQQAIEEINALMRASGNKTPIDFAAIGTNTGVSFANSIQNQKPQAKLAGENLIDGTKNGIQNQNKQNSAFNAIWNFGNSLLGRLKSSLKEHSPSKATEEMGIFLLKGLSNGIDDEKKNVLTQASKFGTDVLNSLQSELSDDIGVNANFNGTRNLMMNALTGLSPTMSTNSTAKDLQILTELMNKYMPQIIENMGYKLVLDDNTLVGKLTPKIDKELGLIATGRRRGR